jgi:hypothetical protein
MTSPCPQIIEKTKNSPDATDEGAGQGVSLDFASPAPGDDTPSSSHETGDHGSSDDRGGKPFEQCRSRTEIRENEHAAILHDPGARVARRNQIL